MLGGKSKIILKSSMADMHDMSKENLRAILDISMSVLYDKGARNRFIIP